MVIREEILGMMLGEFQEWVNSPEDFLCFIKLTALLAEADAATTPGMIVEYDVEEQLGDIFVKALEVEFGPYKNYKEIESHYVVKENLLERFEKITKSIQEKAAVSDLMEETGLAPSSETLVFEMGGFRMVKDIIDLLRPYIDFR